jgi:hypothetical protein
LAVFRDNGSISSSSTETSNGDAGTFRNVPIDINVANGNMASIDNPGNIR